MARSGSLTLLRREDVLVSDNVLHRVVSKMFGIGVC